MRNIRSARVKAEHLKPLSSATTAASITSVSPDDESIAFDVGASQSQVAHPFVSGEAWFRSQPSVGTKCTISYNSTLQRYEFVAYTQTADQARDRLTRYKNKKSLYQPLQEGEHELMSSGNVTEFWGSRPVKSSRAGAVSWTYDGDKLEATATAPTHIKRGHRNQTDRIGNEMRFGVVKRPTSAANEMYALAAPFSNPVADLYTYAYEHLINLSNDNDAPLIDHREGEVYDDVLTPGVPFAKPALGKQMKLPLRSRKRYHATMEPGGLPLGLSTDIEIDCLGNVQMDLAESAIGGFKLSAPMGGVEVNAGLQAKLIAQLAVKIASELASVAITSKLNTGIKSGLAMKIDAGTSLDISAVAKATMKALSLIIEADTTAEISGKAGLTLTGAMGKTGRIINTLQQDYVTGLPTFVDPTLTS